MMDGEYPIKGAYYMCHSRNAILQAVEWDGSTDPDGKFTFEWVIAMSQWPSNQKPAGYREEIEVRHLRPLHEINEMEALAYASR